MRVALLSLVAVLLFAIPSHAQTSARFANVSLYDSGGPYAYAIAVGDVNGDGKPDLVVANQCNSATSCEALSPQFCTACYGSISVYLGVGDGTFQFAESYSPGGDATGSVALADVNGDGKLDIIVNNGNGGPAAPHSATQYLPGSIGVLLGNGDGTFQHAVTIPSTFSVVGPGLVVADVNADGKPDILLTIQCATDACGADSQVAVYLGNGDGTFQAPVTYDSGGYVAETISIQDINGDGHPDIVVANQCPSGNTCGSSGSVGVLLGNGDGTFRSPVTYGSGGLTSSATIADVNGDGKPDVLVGNYCNTGACTGTIGTAGVLLGNGDGTFRAVVTYSSGGYAQSSVGVADVDGDGKPDLVVASQCPDTACDNVGTVGVLKGNGDGTFQPVVNFSTGAFYAYQLVIADLNGDSKPDLLVLNGRIGTANTDDGAVGVLLNISEVNGPIVSLSQSNLTFASTAIGTTSAPQTVMLSNLGNASLTISSIQIAGAGGSPFSQTNSCGASVPASSNCVISVIYAPTTNDLSTATLTITDGAAGSPHKVGLLGSTGTITTATISPGFVSFGSFQIGLGGVGVNLTLTNTGTSALNIPHVSVSSSEFGATATCTAPVPPGGTCLIGVSFNPTTPGAKSATVTITDNATGAPQVVMLTGTGVAAPPRLNLSPATVTFPSQYVGTTGLPQTVTLTNTSGSTVTISNATASPADFGVLSNCPAQVAPNATCAIGVFFDPTTGGNRTGTLSVVDTGTGSSYTVALTGSGRDFSMTPSSTPSVTVSAGQTANFSLAITPTSGFAQNVALSCSGGPAMSTCSVSPSSVALSGTAAKTVTVSVATSSQGFVSPFGGMNRQQRAPLILVGAILALISLLAASSFLQPSRRLRWAPALTLLLLACLTMTLTSCGGGSGSGGSGSSNAESGTYTVTVTGNFSSGSSNITHATQLTLVVH
jgi:FG-GAP-like repeat/Abnormal spindle-like microcephaly-assoc'd, ASPM-SPD-2-Hydin/FG-GAP repeat